MPTTTASKNADNPSNVGAAKSGAQNAERAATINAVLKVSNVELGKLTANKVLLDKFQNEVKAVFAAETANAVLTEGVTVELSSEENELVTVRAVLSLADGVSAIPVQSTLQAAMDSHHLDKALATKVNHVF